MSHLHRSQTRSDPYGYQEDDDDNGYEEKQQASVVTGRLHQQQADPRFRTPITSRTSTNQQRESKHSTSHYHENTPGRIEAAADSRTMAGSASPVTPASSNSHSSNSSSKDGGADKTQALYAAFNEISNSLPPNLQYLQPSFQSFFDRCLLAQSKYRELKTKHGTLKAATKELQEEKRRLEEELEQVRRAVSTSTPSTPASPPAPSSSPNPAGTTPGTDLERLNFEILRLKKKVNNLQELARKTHEENLGLRTDMTRAGVTPSSALQQNQFGQGSMFGSLLMGGSKDPTVGKKLSPKDEEIAKLQKTLRILQEEFQLKLSENESLHQKIWTQGIEQDEKERLLSQRLLEIKSRLATVEGELEKSESNQIQLKEEYEQAEQQLREELNQALESVRGNDARTQEIRDGHAHEIARYEKLVSDCRTKWIQHGGWDDLEGSSATNALALEWANIDADSSLVTSSSAPSTFLQTLPPTFSHTLFTQSLSMIDDFLVLFGRLKTQLASILRYWREMKGEELNTIQVSSTTQLLPTHEIASMAQPVKNQISELNQLLTKNEEVFSRFIKDLEGVRKEVEGKVKWREDLEALNDESSSPLPLNALLDSFLPLLKLLSRLIDHEVSSLETRLATMASSRGGGGQPLRQAIGRSVQTWTGVGMAVKESIKQIVFLPGRTGQQVQSGAHGLASSSSNTNNTRRHPAYAASLAVPAAWPILFLFEALHGTADPSVSASYTPDPSWPHSPLPFLGTLHSALTNLTSSFAVLVGEEGSVVAGQTAGAVGASTASAASALPNFILSNLATINKLLGNLPNLLVKHATRVKEERRRVREGNLTGVRVDPRRIEQGKTRKDFSVKAVLGLVPNKIDEDTAEGVEPKQSTATLVASNSISSTPSHSPSSIGGIHSMISLRSQATGYMSLLRAQAATGAGVEQGVPYTQALHQTAQLSSSTKALQVTRAHKARLEGELRDTQNVRDQFEKDLALAKEQHIQLQQRMSDANTAFEDKLEEARLAHATTSKELEETQGKLREEQSMLARTKETLQQREASLEERNRELEQAKNDAMAREESFAAERTQLTEKQAEELLTAREAAEQREKELQESHTATINDHQQSSIAREKGLRVQHEAAVASMQQSLDSLTQRETELQGQLVELRQSELTLQKQLAAERSLVQTLRVQVEHQAAELLALRNKASEARSQPPVVQVKITPSVDGGDAADNVRVNIEAMAAAGEQITSTQHDQHSSVVRTPAPVASFLPAAATIFIPERPITHTASTQTDVEPAAAAATTQTSTQATSSPPESAVPSVPSPHLLPAPVQTGSSTEPQWPGWPAGSPSSSATAVVFTPSTLSSPRPVTLAASPPVALSIEDVSPSSTLSLEQILELERLRRNGLNGGYSKSLPVPLHAGSSSPLRTPPRSHRSSSSLPSPSASPSQLLAHMHSCADSLLAAVVTLPGASPLAQRGVGVDEAVQVDLLSPSTEASSAEDTTKPIGGLWTSQTTTTIPPLPLRALDDSTVSKASSASATDQPASASISADTATRKDPSPTEALPALPLLELAQATLDMLPALPDADASGVTTFQEQPLYRVLVPPARKPRATDEIDPSDLEEDSSEEHEDGPLTTSSPPSPLFTGGVAIGESSRTRKENASGGSTAASSSSSSSLRSSVLLSRLSASEEALSSMQTLLSESDSKATMFFAQITDLTSLLQAAKKESEEATGRAEKAQATILRLQEELKSTKLNYEGMNIELTEKVCQLTEQLAMQDAKGKPGRR